MDIKALMDLYIKERISLNKLKLLLNSYTGFLTSLLNKSNSPIREAILKKIKVINETISIKTDLINSYEQEFKSLIDNTSNEEKLELLDTLNNRNQALKEMIDNTGKNLQTMAFDNHIVDQVNYYYDSMIKPNIIPKEYAQKELYLKNLIVLKDCNFFFREIITNSINNQQKPKM